MIVATIIKYVISGDAQVVYSSFVTQYSDDGVTVGFSSQYGMHHVISVNDGVMTVIVKVTEPGITVTDGRCCLIPGDPFA